MAQMAIQMIPSSISDVPFSGAGSPFSYFFSLWLAVVAWGKTRSGHQSATIEEVGVFKSSST
jgi:hypothetical protein